MLILDTDRRLDGGLSGQNWAEALTLLGSRADRFTLSRQRLNVPFALEELLAPHLENTHLTDRWFGWYGMERQVNVYRASPEALALLAQSMDDVFFLKCSRKRKKQGGQPEDLCFFRDGAAFFATLSHELICACAPLDASQETALRCLAAWREVQDDPYHLRELRL